MKIADELRTDGSTRYRVQHKDPVKAGRYTTRRFDTHRDAAEFVRRAGFALNDAIAWDDERRGIDKRQQSLTFAEYASAFIKAHTDTKQVSRAKMESRLSTVLRVEAFASLRMDEITVRDIENFKLSLSELESNRGGELLKSRTKNAVLALVFQVIRRAVVIDDIPRDVTMGVSKYRVDDAKQTCPITVDEFDSIMTHVTPQRRALFRVLLDSGLRISEALALTWDDIRETRHGIFEISVWALDAEAGKSAQAQRVTTIPAETFKMIRKHNGTRVFLDSYNAYSSDWRNAVLRAQSAIGATDFPALLKSPTIHDLRHSHASFLIVNCGFNLAIVAERLGHANISVTQKYYGRLVKEQAHELGLLVAQSIPRGVVM